MTEGTYCVGVTGGRYSLLAVGSNGRGGGLGVEGLGVSQLPEGVR